MLNYTRFLVQVSRKMLERLTKTPIFKSRHAINDLNLIDMYRSY